MHLFRYARTWIKLVIPRGLYMFLSGVLMPVVSAVRSRSARSFEKRQVRRVSHRAGKFLMILDPENGLVDRAIYTSGVHEPEILDLMTRYLPFGGVFVDIGANIGQHSLYAAAIMGENGKVISFEPIPRIAAQLRESIDLNSWQDNITVKECACGDENGTSIIHVLSGNVGGSSLVPGHGDFNEQISISVVRADDILRGLASVHMIKIDAEGFEKKVFDGLVETIKKHQPVIIFEYSPIAWGNNASSIGKYIFETHLSGYKFYDVEDGLREIVDKDSWTSNFTERQTNILCVPTKNLL